MLTIFVFPISVGSVELWKSTALVKKKRGKVNGSFLDSRRFLIPSSPLQLQQEISLSLRHTPAHH